MTIERPEEVIANAISRLRQRGGLHREMRGGESGVAGEAGRRRFSGSQGDETDDRGYGTGQGGRRGGGQGGGTGGGRSWGGGHGRREHGGPALRRLVVRLDASLEPLSVSDIAAEVGVDQPRASRLVAQGVEMGLLRRELDPEDARRTRIVLTNEGRGHAEHLRQAHQDAVAGALVGFSEVERSQLAQLLERFADAWQGGRA